MKTAAEEEAYGAVNMTNFRSVYPMLRVKPPSAVSLTWTAL